MSILPSMHRLLRRLVLLLVLAVVSCSVQGNPGGGPTRARATPGPSGEVTCTDLVYDASKLPAPLPQAGTPPAGAVPGSFSVSPQGQASYHVPLVVPPGRLGMEPRLSIHYDSSAGDGLLGVGFSLQGLSAVTRCAKNIAQDGKASAVVYDDTDPDPRNRDALCLDGLRLVEVASSVAGANEFRTLPDTFSKIVGFRAPTVGWTSFEVRTKAGRILEYGATPDSKVKTTSGATGSWWVSRERDRRGNDVRYAYANIAPADHTVEMLPYTITYGQRSVGFEYVARPVVHHSFTGGMSVQRSSLLGKVHMVGPGGTPVRTYSLAYSPSPGTKRPRLDSLTECTGDGDTGQGSVCRPPTRFRWSGAKAKLAPAIVTPPIALYSGPRYPWVLGDVNGDGLPDIVALTPANGLVNQAVDVVVALGNGQSFAPPAEWLHAFPEPQTYQPDPQKTPWQLIPIDLDQDGRTDFVLDVPSVKASSWPYYKWLHAKPGGGFEALDTKVHRPDGTGLASQHALRLGDLDGDGVGDLIECANDANGGTPSWRAYLWSPALATFDPASVVISPLQDRALPCDTWLQVVDVQGSGASDILFPIADPSDPFQPRGMSARLEKKAGQTWTWVTRKTGLPVEPQIRWIDANGDGLPDALYPFYHLDPNSNSIDDDSPGVVFFNQGLNAAGVVPATLFPVPDPLPTTNFHFSNPVPLDYDGDTQTDFLDPNGPCPAGTPLPPGADVLSCWQVLVSHPSGMGGVALVDTDIIFDTTGWFMPVVADVNGDSRHDIVVANLDKGGYDTGTFLVYLNSPTTGAQDLLAGVSDGMSPLDPGDPGHVPTVSITYGNLVDASITQNLPHGSPAAESLTYLSQADVGNDCVFPRSCVKGPSRVVSHYALNNGENGKRSFTLRYRDGRYHRLGRGMLGFGQRIVLDDDAGSGTAELYDNITYDSTFDTYPFAGQVVESWTWSPADPIKGTQVSTQVELVYRHTALLQTQTSAAIGGGPGTYFVFAWNNDVKREEGTYAPFFGSTLYDYVSETALFPATVLGHTSTVVSSWDLYGNILAEDTFTEGVDQHDSVTRTVSNDPATWLLGLVLTEQACSATTPETRCRTTVLDHNPYGEVTTAAIGDPSDPDTQVVTTTLHDSHGNVVRATADDQHNNHRVTCVSYEPEGIFPYGARNTVGHTVLTAYDPGLGVPTGSVDPNGLVTRYQLDGFGRVARVNRPDGTFVTSTLTRTKDGGPQKAWWNVKVVVEEDTGPRRTTELDGAGRPVHSVQLSASTRSCGASACGPLLVLEQSASYDLFGRASRVTLPWQSGDSLQGQLADTYQYDLAGRLRKHTEPWGRVTTYAYGDDIASATDWLGTAYSKVDALGRTTLTVDRMGGSVAIDYGPFGLPRAVTRFGSEKTTMKRDAYGRVVQEIDPDRGQTDTAYDGFGQARHVEDASGRIVDFTHDGIGRLVHRVDSGSGKAHGTTTWTYDTMPGGVGRLASVASPQHHVDTYTYDPLSRLVGHKLEFGDTGDTLSWRLDYDGLGRPFRLTYPTAPGVSPLTVRREYDAYGNLIALHDDTTATTLWQLRQLDGAGRATDEALPNDVLVTRAYQPSTGLVTHVGSRWFKSKTQHQTLQDLSYTHDLGLRLTSRTDNLQPGLLGGTSEVFRHDASDRITCASFSTGLGSGGLGCESPIQYLPNGNIDVKDGLQYAYDQDHPHAVASVGPAGGAAEAMFAYDAVGNQEQRITGTTGLVSVEHTAFDLPARYAFPGGGSPGVSLDYDGSQHRIRKRSGLNETVYLDGLYERVRDMGGDVHRYYVAAGSSTVVLTRAPGAPDKMSFLLAEALGSTDVVTDGNGTVVERRSYDAFGARRNPVWGGPKQTSFTPTVSPLGFTGQEADDDHGLGLVNLNGRIYDPKIGRFTSTDPLVGRPHLSQSWNPYSYVMNSPLNFTDPSGWDGDANAGNVGNDAIGRSNITFDLDPIFGKVPVGPVAPALPPSDIVRPQEQVSTGRDDQVGPSVPADAGAPLSIGVFLLPSHADLGQTLARSQERDWEEQKKAINNQALGMAGGLVLAALPVRIVLGLGLAATTQIQSSDDAAGHLGAAGVAAGAAGRVTVAPGSEGSLVGAVRMLVADTRGSIGLRGPAATRELAERVQGTVPRSAQTVALLETAEGPTIAAGGAKDLSAAQKELARQLGLTPAPDLPGFHAEQTAIQGAAELGLTPTRGVATNEVCQGRCGPLITSIGGWFRGNFFGF